MIKKTLSERTFYRIIGSTFFSIFILFILFTYQNNRDRKTLTSQEYELHAYFKDIDGLKQGSNVLLAGLTIGHVIDIRFSAQRNVDVKLAINKNIQIPVDSSIRILSNDLMGKKYIAVTPGNSLDKMQPGQSFDYVQNSVNITLLLEKALNLLESKKHEQEKNKH